MNPKRRTTVARSQRVRQLVRHSFSEGGSLGEAGRSEVKDQRSEVSVSCVALAKREGQRSVFRYPSSAFSGLASGIRCPASGFTLIELLVVIVVIAILMGITIPVSKYAVVRAKTARQEVMLAKIHSALDDYRATYGEYPITPVTNLAGLVTSDSYPDAIRHYPDNYPTYCNSTSNSPFTNVYLTSSGTVENIVGCKIDYCLTYPLMLKQSDKGARPFYTFPDVTVVSLVYRRWGGGADVWTGEQRRKGGAVRELRGLRGAQVNRPKAIDPVSMRQWKYKCYDGTSYTITTNVF